MHGNTTLPKELVQHTVEHIRLLHLNVVAMVLFNLREIRNKINLMWLMPLGPLQQLPANEKSREEEDLLTMLVQIQVINKFVDHLP